MGEDNQKLKDGEPIYVKCGEFYKAVLIPYISYDVPSMFNYEFYEDHGSYDDLLISGRVKFDGCWTLDTSEGELHFCGGYNGTVVNFLEALGFMLKTIEKLGNFEGEWYS